MNNVPIPLGCWNPFKHDLPAGVQTTTASSALAAATVSNTQVIQTTAPTTLRGVYELSDLLWSEHASAAQRMNAQATFKAFVTMAQKSTPRTGAHVLAIDLWTDFKRLGGRTKAEVDPNNEIA